jgi:ABC-2 type transport system ATP-binding protein
VITGNGDLAIETHGLRKRFGKRTAVSDLSLTVKRGEIFGFLGPNGAGKSTSIKMLLGLVHPSGGEAQVLGKPIGDTAVRRSIGFLPEDFRFYDWLTPTELLDFHGRLAGVPRAVVRARAAAALDTVGLSVHADRRLRGFSKGMLQRVGLAQAIIHSPQLIFLDEPTSGLDPMGRRMVRDVIWRQRDQGTTVFLNSHILSEIEITCDRVAFIKDGSVVEHLDLRTATAASERDVAIRASGLTSDIVARLSLWATGARLEGDELSFGVQSEESVPAVVRFLVEQGCDVFRVSPKPTSLEDRFIRLVGEDRGL